LKEIVLLLISATLLPATSVTVGTSNAANCLPFCGQVQDGISDYQQVYSSTPFSGILSISSIDFFLASSLSGNRIDSETLLITLSTTSVAVDNLSYHNPASNIGTNVQTFGIFTIGGISPNKLTFTGTPFTYNPAHGNLLVEIVTLSASGPQGNDFTYFASDNSGTVTSRVCEQTECNENQGLVTEFDSAAVPEPASLGLAMVGIITLAIKRKRYFRSTE
jgi:hypothetical protein